MQTTARPRPRAVLLGVQLPGVSDAELDSSLDELARLGRTLGIEMGARVTQKRPRLAPGTVVGGGKLKELAHFTGGSGVVPMGPPERKSRQRADEADAAEPSDDEQLELEGSGAPPEENGTSAPKASVVLVDHDLSPSQARNLERANLSSLAALDEAASFAVAGR